MAGEEEFEGPLAGEGQRAGGGSDPHGEAAVGDKREDDLGTQALREARIQRLDRPLRTQAHGDGRRQQLNEERGAGLANDVAAERAAQQPDARHQATQAGQELSKHIESGAADRVPGDENEAARDAQDGGGDNVNNPPTEGNSGSHAKILPS